MKKILEVFRTYADAYLEYVNNWIDYDNFAELYELDSMESSMLLDAVVEMKAQKGKWTELDYYYNIVSNKNYIQKQLIY